MEIVWRIGSANPLRFEAGEAAEKATRPTRPILAFSLVLIKHRLPPIPMPRTP